MAKKAGSAVLNFVVWLTGVVVSLAVGFGLVNGTLKLPEWLGGMTVPGVLVTQLAGWVVLVTTIVGVILALMKK